MALIRNTGAQPFVYFISSHDKEVNIAEQNQQNQKVSSSNDIYFFHFFNVPSRGRGPKLRTNLEVYNFLRDIFNTVPEKYDF